MYMYKVLRKHSKRALGTMIGAHFMVPGLGLAVM